MPVASASPRLMVHSQSSQRQKFEALGLEESDEAGRDCVLPAEARKTIGQLRILKSAESEALAVGSIERDLRRWLFRSGALNSVTIRPARRFSGR
jgi:hypothetical protein